VFFTSLASGAACWRTTSRPIRKPNAPPKPETHKLMLTPQTQVIAGGANSLNNPRPQPVADVAWGLGVGLQTTPEGAGKDGLSFWHWGDNGNAKAYFVAFDQSKLGVVFFANCVNGLAIAREIVEQAVGGAHPALSWFNYKSYK
jgi:CubicO group peptidase (beta-lactamase class C family)